MNHEEALIRATAGGLLPAEVLAHMDGCAPCRDELESLRRLERDIEASMPSWEPPPGFGERLAAGLLRSRPPRWQAWGAAAVAAGFGLGLVLSWLSLGRIPQPPAGHGVALQEDGVAAPWREVDEDGTTALLDALQSGFAAAPDHPPAAVADYLCEEEDGGENG